MSNTPQSIRAYYAGLLILQYIGKPKAFAHIEALVTPVLMPQTTVETISFSGVAASGTFVLSYDGNSTAAINWNDSISVINGKINALPGLSLINAVGSIASQLITVTFTGVEPIADPLVVVSNSLQTSGSLPISLTITETDNQLPFDVQNAFNVTGSNIAQGVQLDVIGKYVGVSRNGYDFTGPITLDDTDFLTLIRVAIIKNALGSSLADIQSLLHMFFPGTLLVFDYANMHMDYFFDSSIGSKPLAELFVKEGVLPKPMGVELGALIYAANVNSFFGFVTYSIPTQQNSTGFNNYVQGFTLGPWLSYAYAIVP